MVFGLAIKRDAAAMSKCPRKRRCGRDISDKQWIDSCQIRGSVTEFSA